MAKITNDQIGERDTDLNTIYGKWASVNESLILFEKKATKKSFEYVFGEQSERLYNHFRIDCDSKFQRFLTYLTQDQKNEFIINCHENQIELYLP